MAIKKTSNSTPKKILVIVESPAKAKTIEKYLGSQYQVTASMGHLIDLPKSRIAIDLEHNFEPEYITVRGRAQLLKDIQSQAKNAALVLLASDNDREGEAIAYHLRKAILAKNPNLLIKRISFNEITPAAIKEAITNPSEVDENKVNAQKARRVLDRLVGYNLSPLLWKKVKNGLSAGRVQSVALRLICDREREVESFIPEEYWTLEGDFRKGRTAFVAELTQWQGRKPELKTEKAVAEVIQLINNAPASISDIRQSEKTLKPKPPFTTSTLQQLAANRLGFTSKKTMQIAQQLYEGVNVGSSRVGLITYMRTDSVRLSKTAVDELRAWIGEQYPEVLPAQPLEYTTGKKAQDAHEAIRPTYVTYTPESLKNDLSRDQARLYAIIWERFVACQMKNAKSRTQSFEITLGDAVFRASFTQLIEAGFTKVLKLLVSKDDKSQAFPDLKVGDSLEVIKLRPEQHFTQGPARFTDASIIKTLDELGIGRPSTYAPIISVLLDRYYVNRVNKQLVPTLLGKLINDMLVEYFPNVVDVNFTAGMESKLDGVEENRLLWSDMIRDFYDPFDERVKAVTESLASYKGSMDEATDQVCEKCGKPMVKKLGRFGYFLACTGFPDCRNTRSLPLAPCPMPGCSGEIVARRTKAKGKEFYGCTKYPDCSFISHYKFLAAKCPNCGFPLVEKTDKKNGAHKACINPACDYLHSPEAEGGHDGDA